MLGDKNRNEKCLAAMASGKWLLRKSFLDASQKAGRFVSVIVTRKYEKTCDFCKLNLSVANK